MSVLQTEDLVSYQLRSNYLDDIGDGVGERLITLNDGFLATAPYKAAGWRTNHALSKRSHSPPIPTAIRAEYFQAPRARFALEEEVEDVGLLATSGADTHGPDIATKRRRRREHMEEDDSSDLSDESDEEADSRAGQQIKFAKLPVRSRAGSSPLQSSNLRQYSTTVSSPRAGPGTRRGSQSALEIVKERVRRDTVTSSEVSSENEFDASGSHQHREVAREAGRLAAAKASRRRAKSNDELTGGKLQDSIFHPEDEEESDNSDLDGAFGESIDSTSILDGVENPLPPASPTVQVVGTPPRFTRTSTIRRSHAPQPRVLTALPPPRPLSTIRPVSMAPPVSMLSELLNSKKSKSKPMMPLQRFASLSGQGDTRQPFSLRIYLPFSEDPEDSLKLLMRRDIIDDAGSNPRPVTVVDLLGLSLLRYVEEKKEPPLPAEKLNVNKWILRMVEDGEIEDDFPPLDRRSALSAFTTANNRAGGASSSGPARGPARMRANSKVHDDFALVEASAAEYEENKAATPEYEPEVDMEGGVGEEDEDADATPRRTPQQFPSQLVDSQPRQDPVLTTTYRHRNHLDQPQVAASAAQTLKGHQKLLRINILSADATPGQLVTVDVTTDTWLTQVRDTVCKKRQLDPSWHVFSIAGTQVKMDRPVSSLGAVSELDIIRARPQNIQLSTTGSPGSSSPKMLPFTDGHHQRRWKKDRFMGAHPLAREALREGGELGNGNYKKYTVWRKQPMRIVGMSERILVIDGEYIHIMAASGGKAIEGRAKVTTVHFSNVVGCKVMRKHPTTFKIVVYKATESKRYDFEARNANEAADIVQELKKGISPYREV
ncbi:related to stress activated MAP kinase interacting protein [Cephalotrichum gorgonifer]|uniref:Related to stress activated MAP kinase interacting protein n=1 Tax=Cephalotrichum gorgonifer TaxID=2041049 RepID=A0AAE8SUM2_9PEZI|nr:related to stress activated MAP kinase interacting protein [Cephalotrichum gorgonifer]